MSDYCAAEHVREINYDSDEARELNYESDDNGDDNGAHRDDEKVFVPYETVVNEAIASEREAKRDDEAKKSEEHVEIAELAKKKKVSDLISRFNTGAAFNQSSGTVTHGTYKGDYGVGKGSGAVNTGRFK